MRPATLRRELARLLDRLGLADEHAPPREIAVVLALRDGIPLRDALERLGVDTAPLDLPPPPEAVPFERIAPGCAFTWRDHTWTRATLDQALGATPDRAGHPRVVAAYLAATQRGHPATAFRWTGDPPACVADRVEPDEPVTPAAPPPEGPSAPAGAPPAKAWVPAAERSPDLGQRVTIDTASGERAARLVLSDESAGGVVWLAASGERLDLDDVPRWRP